MAQKKGKAVRIVLFVLALVIAVSAFTIGVRQYLHRENGYYPVELTPEANVVAFGSGLHLVYYAEGSSGEIRMKIHEVQKVYSDLVLRYVRLLDERQTYENLANLATLNQGTGETCRVDQDLISVLADAAARTRREEGYSLFAGALNAEWETLLYLEDASDADPAHHAEEAAKLAALADAAQHEDWFDLRLDDEKGTASFAVSPAYSQALDALEAEKKYALDLGPLKDAYLIELVAREMNRQGYDRGYLYSDAGCSLLLKGESAASFALFGWMNGQPVQIAWARFDSNAAFCQRTAFSPFGARYGYYTLEEGEALLMRHAGVNVRTGLPGNVLLSAALGAEGEDLVELAYQNFLLNGQMGANAVESALSALPEHWLKAYTLQEDAQPVLYADENGIKRISMIQDSGFMLRSILR